MMRGVVTMCSLIVSKRGEVGPEKYPDPSLPRGEVLGGDDESELEGLLVVGGITALLMRGVAR